MKQISFAQAEHQNKKKITRRERFPAQMDALMPWQRLIKALSPSCFLKSAGASAVGHRLVWNGCCGSISFSNGTDWPMKRLKMPSMTVRPCVTSSVSTLPSRVFPTRPRCFVLVNKTGHINLLISHTPLEPDHLSMNAVAPGCNTSCRPQHLASCEPVLAGVL